jgi:hypothetical protein
MKFMHTHEKQNQFKINNNVICYFYESIKFKKKNVIGMFFILII